MAAASREGCVGGIRDKVTGATKIATWLAYQRVKKEMGLSTPEEQEEQGMYESFPSTKRDAYSRMKPGKDGKGWELWYHFHS